MLLFLNFPFLCFFCKNYFIYNNNKLKLCCLSCVAEVEFEVCIWMGSKATSLRNSNVSFTFALSVSHYCSWAQYEVLPRVLLKSFILLSFLTGIFPQRSIFFIFFWFLNVFLPCPSVEAESEVYFLTTLTNKGCYCLLLHKAFSKF